MDDTHRVEVRFEIENEKGRFEFVFDGQVTEAAIVANIFAFNLASGFIGPRIPPATLMQLDGEPVQGASLGAQLDAIHARFVDAEGAVWGRKLRGEA